jgi:phosphoribosylformylglycinamidine (FGAM) synthase PurS component
MSNVIPFERPKKSVPQPEENIANKIAESLISNLSYYGYEISEDISDVKRLAFLLESINALLSDNHPFHHLAEKLFQNPVITKENIEFKFKINEVYEM